MSVSIDDNPSEHESAESVLSGWLDDLQAGRCERADLEEAFISVCSSDSEASWVALSLLDRYQRLRRVDPELARELKSRISQLAVGAPPDAVRRPPAKTATEQPRASTRQRASASEPQTEDGHTDDIDPDRTVIRKKPVELPVDLHETSVDEDFDEEEEEEDELPAPPPARPQPKSASTRERSSFAERADEIRSTIEARESRKPTPQRERTVERPVAPAAVSRPTPSPRAQSAGGTGPRVLRDRYELLSVLAQGGTGAVYKALDRHRANLSESARYVAVKVLNARYDSRPDALAQLEREFHQAQSLSHPNIASVFDLDRDGSTYFIVMELLEGDSLASVLRRLNGQPMARKNALGLIGAIGAALAHAHRRDVVHGDLKPRNVMITDIGEVRVLEFGFARSAMAQHGDVEVEHGNVAIGTPAYASAERVHGLDPDPSDDVYSLACIAYELLSGRHPYGGRSALLARAHGRRPQRIAGLSHKQWHALQRALAWDRADRKIDVVELLAALGTSEAGHEPVPAALLSIPDDVRGRRMRRLGAVAAIVAAVALVFYFVTRIPPPVQSVDIGALPIPAPSDTDPSASQAPATSAAAPTEPSEADADASSTTPQSAAPQTTAPQSTVAASQPSRSDAAQTPSSTQPRSQERERTESPARSTPAPALAPVTIEFAKDTFVVTESDSAVSLEVRRSGSTNRAVNFRWSLRSNSAEAGTDFADIGPGVEQIPAGARTATILIPIVSDAIVENTELFLVELEAVGEGVTVGELAHAAVIIVDDD